MQRLTIPQHPRRITPEWLTLALRTSSTLPGDASVQRIAFDDPGREASYAGYVARLIIDYDRPGAGAPRSMILKLPAPERLIRRIFSPLYRNEARFYRQIAANSPVSTPKCYAALLNRDRNRTLLLIEDLADLATVGDHDAGCSIEQARIALTSIARMHAAWWESPDLDAAGWLGRYRVNSWKNWLIYAGAWAPFQLRLRRQTPTPTLQLFRNLWRFRDRLRRLEAGRPHTLHHGDFRLANLAFTDDDVFVFDWQVVRAGSPLFDVAWFMLTSLEIDQRREHEADLLRAYHVALIQAGVTGYTMEDLIDDYRFALLLTIPQIMVIGGFLRIDPARKATLGTLLRRFEAARVDHDLDTAVRE
jgi:hypothetical protein